MKLGSNNKYSNMKKKNNKKKVDWKMVGISLGTAAVVICTYQFGVLNVVQSHTRENTIKELTNSKGEYVRAFVLNKKIDKGQEIKEQDLIQITENSKLVPINYIKSKDQVKGQVSRIVLSENTVVSMDMIVKTEDLISNETKNQDYDWIKVHAFLKQGNFIDIHYKKKDGTDFIVCSKKKVHNLNGNVFSINITEEERAYINNATVLASLTEGVLYTSIYPDPENQTPAAVTYQLDPKIKTLIENNPNIVKDSANKLKDKKEPSTETENTQDSNGKGQKPQFIERHMV